MHGGELSDIEFHESRCDYWRKAGWARVKFDLDIKAAADLERARQHPDKGRTDAYPAVIMQMSMDLPP